MPETIARVMLEIENRAIANGYKIYLVRDEATNLHALARCIADGGDFAGARNSGAGERWHFESKWIDVEKATEIAYRVAGGDMRAVTHPGVTQAFAIVLLAAAVRAEEMRAEAIKDAAPERPT